ncbi:MAG: RnfH family protein [Gammaproteobacteria bacterium]|nr:RnfH family protein [Gammaproteobacteria bacterium]
MIGVEVVYALPDHQILIPLQVPEGTTALQAVRLSGIAGQVADLDVSSAEMGIYSRLLDGRASPLPQDYVLRDHDRIELYRPLQLDPKQARLLRAARAAERERRAEQPNKPAD